MYFQGDVYRQGIGPFSTVTLVWGWSLLLRGPVGNSSLFRIAYKGKNYFLSEFRLITQICLPYSQLTFFSCKQTWTWLLLIWHQSPVLKTSGTHWLVKIHKLIDFHLYDCLLLSGFVSNAFIFPNYWIHS